MSAARTLGARLLAATVAAALPCASAHAQYQQTGQTLSGGGGASSSAGYSLLGCLSYDPAGAGASADYRVESGCGTGMHLMAGLQNTIDVTGGSAQSAAVGQPFALPLEVRVRDAYGDPVAGVVVTFTPPSSGASASLSMGTSVTDALGLASVTATANGTVGSYLVSAAVGGLPAASFSLENVAFTFVVNAADDVVDAQGCDAFHCSLREAVDAANAHAGPDVIEFGLPGGGPYTITLGTEVVSYEAVTIDGTTQAGWTGDPIVRVDGAGASSSGLRLEDSGSTVKGLVLTRFMGGGALVLSGSGGHTLVGSWVGLDATGAAAAGNAVGVLILSSGNSVGQAGTGLRNVISANGTGVRITGTSAPTGNLVVHDLFGVGGGGTGAFGNGTAVFVDGDDTTVGGTAAGTGNLIANSSSAAVIVAGGPTDRTGNRIQQNRFVGNAGLAIDLGGDGPTANDPGDADSGPNLRQNTPLVLGATRSAAVVVSGVLHSAPDTTYRIDFYASPACNGSAEVVVASATAFTDGAGDGTFKASGPASSVHLGDSITATATDPAGNTSELSACRTVTANPAVSAGPASVGEAGGTLAFPITLSVAGAETVEVSYSLGGGTATPSADYDPTGGTVTFPPGVTTQTASVSVFDDSLAEPDETLVLTLSAPVHAKLGTRTATGTIVDDDAYTLSIADSSATEGDTGTTPMTFTVTLSAPSSSSVPVAYAASAGTASIPDDVKAASGTLTFAPGQTTRTIVVNVKGDRIDEPSETFTVTLSSPSNATIADGTATGTILDNDPAPTIAISDTTVTEGSVAVTATLTVTLSNPSASTVTVDYTTTPGTALAGSDYTTKSGTLTFAPGQTSSKVNVKVKADAIAEPTEELYVDLSNPSAGASIGDSRGVITIQDDD